MKKGKELLRDCAKALAVGAAAGAVIALVLFVIGFLAGKFQVNSGLEAAKDGLFFILALGLFLLAGMILAKGKKPEKFSENNGWRNHFSVIGLKTVIGMICMGFFVWGIILDYIMH